MKRDITRLILAVVVSFLSLSAFANTDWSCDPSAYEYDMTVYASVNINGHLVDPATTALVAFVNDECRGVAEAQDMQGHKYYYLRIRSNEANGENVTFKAYIEGEEIDVEPQDPIVFESMSLIGLPSNPLQLIGEVGILGDVNSDGEISAMDITLLISYYLGQQPANFSEVAADLNGDGEVSAMDITLLISEYLKYE